MQQIETDFQHICCPLCGSDEFNPFVEALDRLRVTTTSFPLVRCTRCSLIYQNPRVNPSSIGKYYVSGYYASRPGRRSGATKSVKREILKRQIIEEMGFAPGRLLDVGCANGDFLVEMKRGGWQVEGVEYSEDASKYCQERHGIKVTPGDLTNRPDDGSKFDLITMWGVLPHVPDPLQTVQRAANLLNDQGRLVICCANIESYAFRVSRGMWGHLDQPRHYCMFTPKTLNKLVSDSGLIPGEIVYEGRLWNSQIVLPPVGAMFRIIGSSRTGYVKRVMLKSLELVNSLMVAPLEVAARRLNHGAMILIDARKQ